MYPTPRRTAGTADTGFDASAAVFAAADRDIGLLVSRDPRSALVYRERILCGRTLDRVGAAMGVTRERVRQLERSLSADLVGLRSVGRALNELKRAHAPFAPPEALTGVPRLRTFAHLAPDWSLTPGGWLVVDGADERVDAALTELSDGASPASVADLSAMLGVRRDVVAGYLECVRRMWLIDGGVLVPPRTVGARAAAILRASPGPMTIAQLSELLGDRPRSSLRNSLARTPGVRRCGADVWGTLTTCRGASRGAWARSRCGGGRRARPLVPSTVTSPTPAPARATASASSSAGFSTSSRCPRPRPAACGRRFSRSWDSGSRATIRWPASTPPWASRATAASSVPRAACAAGASWVWPKRSSRRIGYGHERQ